MDMKSKSDKSEKKLEKAIKKTDTGIKKEIAKEKKVDDTVKKEVKKANKIDNKQKKETTTTKIRSSKIKKNVKPENSVIEETENKSWKNKITKKNITYFVLILVDILLVIYVARKNIVNYVKISGHDIFVSKTKYLILGRNYVNIIVTSFFYVYTCIINRFFLKEKNTRKFLIGLLFFLIILNGLLFFLFTKRVY